MCCLIYHWRNNKPYCFEDLDIQEKKVNEMDIFSKFLNDMISTLLDEEAYRAGYRDGCRHRQSLEAEDSTNAL